MAALPPHLDKLRRAAAALERTSSAYAAAVATAQDLKAKVRANAERLAKFEADQGNRRVAIALGDAPADSADDAAEIEELRRNAPHDSRAAEIAAQRVPGALAAMNAAEAVRTEAARDYLVKEAIEPGQARFAAAMEELRAAAADAMGNFHVAHVTHGKNGAANFHNADDMYGPAARLIRELSKADWAKHPFSLKPGWLTSFDFAPWKIPGVAEAERAALAMIEGATQ